MKRNARTAYTKLKKLGVPVIHPGGGFTGNAHFSISAEDENSYLWCDYYGEYRGGYPYIAPEIEKILHDNALFFEWTNAGVISIYDV